MNFKTIRLLLPVALATFALGCASGPLGGILNVPDASRTEFRGTVDRVDASTQRIQLVDRDNRGGLRDVYYDNSSVVQYNGQRYEPRSLERGDEVTVVARRDGDRYWAETITVTYDAAQDGRTGGTRDPGDRTTSLLRGVIDRIDTRERRIDVELSSIDGTSSRRTESIYWDEYSRVAGGSRTYEPRDLREGDRIEVRARRDSDGYYAERIDLVDQYGDNRDNGDSRSLPSEVRGTVSRVDTSLRRIDLESIVYNDLRESGTGTNRPSSVYYDSSTTVEYAGRSYGPADLERGDEIAVDGHSEGSRFIADRVVVTYNARNGR
jgi:hypothetical protein